MGVNAVYNIVVLIAMTSMKSDSQNYVCPFYATIELQWSLLPSRISNGKVSKDSSSISVYPLQPDVNNSMLDDPKTLFISFGSSGSDDQLSRKVMMLSSYISLSSE